MGKTSSKQKGAAERKPKFMEEEPETPSQPKEMKVGTFGNSTVQKSLIGELILYTPEERRRRKGHLDMNKVVEGYDIRVINFASEDRYRRLYLHMAKLCNVILFIYDTEDRKTYEAIPGWMKDASEWQQPNVELMLVGNIVNKDKQREVKIEEAEKFAFDREMMYFELCASEDNGIGDRGC